MKLIIFILFMFNSFANEQFYLNSQYEDQNATLTIEDINKIKQNQADTVPYYEDSTTTQNSQEASKSDLESEYESNANDLKEYED